MSEELWFLTLSGPNALCELTFESEDEARYAQTQFYSRLQNAWRGEVDSIIVEPIQINSVHGDVVFSPAAYHTAVVANYSQVISRSRLVRKVQEDANKPDGPNKFGMN